MENKEKPVGNEIDRIILQLLDLFANEEALTILTRCLCTVYHCTYDDESSEVLLFNVKDCYDAGVKASKERKRQQNGK